LFFPGFLATNPRDRAMLDGLLVVHAMLPEVFFVLPLGKRRS
jgi:hypothetical protein